MKNDLYVQARELNYLYYIQYAIETTMNTAVVYVVGPRNTFAIHHREVRGGNESLVREDHPRATHVAHEGAYEERLKRSCG